MNDTENVDYIARPGQVVSLPDGNVGTVTRCNPTTVRDRDGVYYDVLLSDGSERHYTVFADEPENTYRRISRLGVLVAVAEPAFTVVDVAALLAGKW